MNQDFWTNLPSEITINILLRLPIRNIIISKCVCKPWLHLIETPEFAQTHLSKRVPGLILLRSNDEWNLFTIFDFEEAVEEEDLELQELRYNRITELDVRALIRLPDQFRVRIEGSANGLLFLSNLRTIPNALYICNPITREHIKLPNPKEMGCYLYNTIVSYGFGVSKMSGEYKVVRIYQECVRYPSCPAFLSVSKPKSECQVYTLGTGSWRSIAPSDSLEYDSRSSGVFLNGNLHWLVADLKGSVLISCLNLETELFNRLSIPTTIPESGRFLRGLVVLGDCLCLCDNTSDDEIVIWVMKEYGVDKSWKKEFVISKIPDFNGKIVYPLKVFQDGDILMWWKDDYLFYYSNKTKTIKNFELPSFGCYNAMLHTSSFVSLKSFVIRNVRLVTLGTGSWRSFPPGDDTFEYNSRSNSVFLNGNLHWLVGDLKGSFLISCSSLETELFSRLSCPTLPKGRKSLGEIVVLGDCLCLCDNTSHDDIVIWVMKEYGVEKSWKKEFVISKSPDLAGQSEEYVYPLKVFRDGDILMAWDDAHLFYYSNKTKTTKKIGMFELRYWGCIEAMLHTSSFVSLKSFVIENVNKF